MHFNIILLIYDNRLLELIYYDFDMLNELFNYGFIPILYNPSNKYYPYYKLIYIYYLILYVISFYINIYELFE